MSLIKGVIVVVDVSSSQSMKDSDSWLEFLSEKVPRTAFRYLLVHKADLPNDLRIVSSKNLDIFGE